MKRMLSLMVLLLLAVTLAPGAKAGIPTDLYVEGELIVSFRQDVGLSVQSERVHSTSPAVDQLLERFGAIQQRGLYEPYIIQDRDWRERTQHDKLISFPLDTDMELVANEFKQLDLVRDALPNWLMPTLTETCPTDDPSLGSQWWINTIEAKQAWCIENGDETVIVAGIDTGVDWNHPDLVTNIWVNTGEDPDGDPTTYTNSNLELLFASALDNNTVDDDANGLADDFIGWDFVTSAGGAHPSEDASGADNNPMDTNGHGTGVGAAMAEAGNNGIGGAGAAWGVKLMAMRAGYNTSSGQGLINTQAALNCIAYAVDNGAQVINMSYGSDNYSGTIASAMSNAFNSGALLFGAAGNDGVGAGHYPAGYLDVIAVGATDQNDNRAMFSNYGYWLNISAPGVGCYTAWEGDGYTSWQGTSVASPIAAGVGALVVSSFPDSSSSFWREVVETTTDSIETDQMLGTGRVNAWKAVTQYRWPLMEIGEVSFSDPDGNGHPDPGETVEVYVELSNTAGWRDAENVTVSLDFGSDDLTVTSNNVNIGTLAAGESIVTTDTPLIVEVAASAPNGFWADFDVVVGADPNDYVVADSGRVLVGDPEVLIVDDDGGLIYNLYYSLELDQSDRTYMVWDVLANGGPPSGAVIAASPTLLWHCSGTTDPLTADEQTAISNAAAAGVDILVSGETIDEQLGGSDFYQNVLHAASGSGPIPFHGLNSIDNSGGPVINGSQLVMLGSGANNSVDPDIIEPLDGAVAGWTYVGNDDGVGGIFYEEGDHKLVYFAFNFESVSGDNGTTGRLEQMNAIFDWFGGLSDLPEAGARALPGEYAIEANYPNPFNPTTSLSIALPASGQVRLAVYDLLGRQVATLADGTLAAGRHSFQWDATGNATGVYMVVLEAGKARDARKIVFMK